MPTGLPLDLDSLLDPVAGADQAGSSATYLELRSQLDDLRREVKPEDFEADDPRRPDKPQYADWVKIEDVTRKALAKDSKDLRLAVSYAIYRDTIGNKVLHGTEIPLYSVVPKGIPGYDAAGKSFTPSYNPAKDTLRIVKREDQSPKI